MRRAGGRVRLTHCSNCGAEREEVLRSQVKGEPIKCTETRHKFTLSRWEADEQDGS